VNPKNESAVILTVDAEEWFHVPGSAAYAGESSWDGLPAAFPRAMERTLGFLEEGGWTATFFVLGWLARRYPSEVRAIALAGHEVACHGLEHRLVSGMSPGHFRADVSAAKSLLEDLTGLPVRGFRAPRWSMPRASWPYEALAAEGFAYSSSRLCIAGLGAGNPEPATVEGVREIPVLSSGRGWMAWPAGGTVALRAASLKRLEKARDSVLAQGRPAVYWFHPWELLADAPRVGGGVLFRWSRYARLERLPGRLKALVPPGGRTFGALLAGRLNWG
jgi:polysaccharide deacetylase family protein (PEP-CTERM system associated)